jgi:hypothetical protein
MEDIQGTGDNLFDPTWAKPTRAHYFFTKTFEAGTTITLPSFSLEGRASAWYFTILLRAA